MNAVSRSTPLFTKRRLIKVLTRPESQPARICDSRGIFELTKALKSADKALIVWTLRGWIAHNQAKKKGYRDGHTWTFNSLDRWQEKHFPWLTVKQLATLMTKLVKQGIVIRARRSVHTCYWYRVNETALTSLCASIPSAKTLISQTERLKDKTSEQTAQTSEHKTEVPKEKNPKQDKIKTQQQQIATDTTVVVGNSFSEAEPLSGEHGLDGEGHDAGTIKASMPHELHHDERPFPKVPQKGFPPLAAELVSFGVLPYVAQRLTNMHAEADIRYVLAYARTQANLVNPPGYVVKELEKGVSGVLGLRSVRTPAPVFVVRPRHDPSFTIRSNPEDMVRETERLERMTAEDAAVLNS